MATSALTRGGINYLKDGEQKPDPDDVERNEPQRVRPADLISNLLNTALGDAGLAIINQQFTISTSGNRDQDITFDRYYPKVKVLVKMFSQRVNADQTADPELAADLLTFKTYAEDHGYTFLAVVNGAVERDDLQRIKTEVQARCN